MGKYPKYGCFKCLSNKYMTYDNVNSKKDKVNGDTLVYWCMNEKVHGVIQIAIKEFSVNDSIQSIKAYVFKNREPKNQ